MLQQAITTVSLIITSLIFNPAPIKATKHEYIAPNNMLKTKTSFLQKEIEEEESIPYDTEYVDDEDMEIGVEKVVKEGRAGKITKKFLVTYWYGEEESRELLEKNVVEPTNEIVSRGVKIIWRTVSTPEGERKYWKVIPNVWATSYDKSCWGCNEWTALGTKLDVGTCAVDPKVINLYTEIYVPGYGLCRALDVGGAIKGNKIDVGFYDLKAQSDQVGWEGSHYTDIYLLDNSPE